MVSEFWSWFYFLANSGNWTKIDFLQTLVTWTLENFSKHDSTLWTSINVVMILEVIFKYFVFLLNVKLCLYKSLRCNSFFVFLSLLQLFSVILHCLYRSPSPWWLHWIQHSSRTQTRPCYLFHEPLSLVSENSTEETNLGLLRSDWQLRDTSGKGCSVLWLSRGLLEVLKWK